MKEYIVQAITQETIDSFDAHNAPELIRCKDCKWYDERTSMCDNFGLPLEQTFFCADGERKGETEIIRCKDCTHFVAEDQHCKYHGMYISLKPDNYCTHGERR